MPERKVVVNTVVLEAQTFAMTRECLPGQIHLANSTKRQLRFKMQTDGTDTYIEIMEEKPVSGPDTPNWRTAEEMEAARTAARKYLGSGQTTGGPGKTEPLPPEGTFETRIIRGDITDLYACLPIPFRNERDEQVGEVIAVRFDGAYTVGTIRMHKPPPADEPKPVNFREFT